MASASRTMTLRDGRCLGWAEYGAPGGRPVLAFHGAPACRVLFRDVAPLAEGRGLKLIAPDRPGYGLSDKMPGRSLADWAGDMAALMDHLDIDHAPVLAISGGGPYAVATAVHLGPRVSGLALVSPLGEVGAAETARLSSRAQRLFFVRLPRWRRLLKLGAAASRLAFLAAPGIAYRVFRALLSPADQHALADPDAARLIIDMTQAAIRPGVDGAVSDMAIYGQPWSVDAASIGCSAVLWQGTDDRIVPAALAFDLGRRIPGCEVRRLEAQGHFWVIAHAGEVLDAVAAMAHGS